MTTVAPGDSSSAAAHENGPGVDEVFEDIGCDQAVERRLGQRHIDKHVLGHRRR
jgi:hypothetical protein